MKDGPLLQMIIILFASETEQLIVDLVKELMSKVYNINRLKTLILIIPCRDLFRQMAIPPARSVERFRKWFHRRRRKTKIAQNCKTQLQTFSGKCLQARKVKLFGKITKGLEIKNLVLLSLGWKNFFWRNSKYGTFKQLLGTHTSFCTDYLVWESLKIYCSYSLCLAYGLSYLPHWYWHGREARGHLWLRFR